MTWPEDLNVGRLLKKGWQPKPFRTFVLKIHGRCNLRCDYCYVYEMADQTWQLRPHVMSRAIMDQTALRIAEHANAHGIDAVEVVLHGGEPLLAGKARITHAVTTLRAAMGDRQRVHISIQTNGVLLKHQFLDLLESLGVTIGISIDGDQEMHDRHRRQPDGAGSHTSVAAAAAELSRRPWLFSGILSVIDLRNDPVLAYESLLAFSPPAVDFLLPHGNWSAPPPGHELNSLVTPYADWLIAAFNRWYRAKSKETSVRLFEEIINLLLGGSSSTEGIGLSPITVVVVESDGSIEQSDMLKAAYHTASATGLHVMRDSFDSALLTAGVAARQLGMQVLAEQCQVCPVGLICGGGLYPHRYQAETGFVNPSVYCADLYRLINHIRRQLAADLTPLKPSSTNTFAPPADWRPADS